MTKDQVAETLWREGGLKPREKQVYAVAQGNCAGHKKAQGVGTEWSSEL